MLGIKGLRACVCPLGNTSIVLAVNVCVDLQLTRTTLNTTDREPVALLKFSSVYR